MITNMEVEIITESKVGPFYVTPNDTLEINYKDKVVSKHPIQEYTTINYIGVFKLPGGGFGGYFSTESML